MIQIITNIINDGEKKGDIVFSEYSNPKSLDQYAINFIDLNHEEIWRNKGQLNSSINLASDFESLGTMINNSTKATNIIMLPQDSLFYYNFFSGEYQTAIRLKDMISILTKALLFKILPILSYHDNLLFENTNTKIKNQEIKAAFYFSNYPEDKILSKSIGSDKITTILVQENLIVTTLELDNIEKIKLFLEFFELNDKKSEMPDWINDINFFNDVEQKKNIASSKEEIEKLNMNISLSDKQLEENLKYKSILYTNGDELVEVVFEILTILLDYDLNSFIDKKKEDFIVQLDDITFIGEIKGVNSNIRSENVSQLDVHYQGYLDGLAETKTTETVKSILIMNHQRNKCVSARQPVHEIQINLAKRNNSLIIDTNKLLYLFDQFKNDNLSIIEFKELLKNETGLL